MKILIYGAGGIGGFFGGKLATTEDNVTFIARGAHLKVIQEKGIKVKSITGDFNVNPYLATDDLSKIDVPDLVIFGVKSWQLAQAAKTLYPYCNAQTIFLPLQNGADNAEKLNAVIPKEQVLAGLCRMISFIERPGVISNPDIPPSILFGEQDNERSDRIEKIVAIFAKAGINASIPKNIQSAIWQKFLFITTVSAIGGLTRAPIGVLRENVYLRELMLKTAQEVLSIAKAKNVPLPEDILTKTFAAIDNQSYETTASSQRDIMQGKPSELENFNGYIVQKGKQLGIPTPINEMIYNLLLPQEKLARNDSKSIDT